MLNLFSSSEMLSLPALQKELKRRLNFRIILEQTLE